MTKVNKHKVALCAARSWLWYIDRDYCCSLDYIESLKQFQLTIVHNIYNDIEISVFLNGYRYSIEDTIVSESLKVCIISIFL